MRSFQIITHEIILRQLFSSGSVNIGEYLLNIKSSAWGKIRPARQLVSSPEDHCNMDGHLKHYRLLDGKSFLDNN